MTRFLSIVLFVSLNVVGQMPSEFTLESRSKQLFFEGYYLNSLQSHVFQKDLFLAENEKENIDISHVINALRVNEFGAQNLMDNFLLEHPNSPFSNYVYFDLANYYFAIEKYPYALKWYSKLKADDIAKQHLPKYNFNKGYSYFVSKRYNQAIPYLEKVKENPQYESDAHYYLGHIAYQMEDFEKADDAFKLVSTEGQQEDLNYFKSDMNFRLGRFDQAIVAATLALEQTSSEKEQSELSKIIGESYFNLSNYDKAIPFLEAYEGKKGKWENIDFYQLGFAYYKIQEYSMAIKHFNKVIGNKNKFAQYANYYLADCYLKMEDKPAAFNAFKSASSMRFNPEITEDAFLNYAKLSYDIGNPYENTSKVLVRFLESYPKNNQINNVSELLVNSYLKGKNYDAALEILEGKSFYKDNVMLQQISYLKALNLFQSEDYRQAITFFEKSIKVGRDLDLKAAATYWMGHAHYESKNYDLALDVFMGFKKIPKKNPLALYKNIDYDIAYAHFKKEAYPQALEFFQRFLRQNTIEDTSYKRDVFLRIADCNFILKKYWPAMENYNEAIAIAPQKSTYALYQKGISYGFVDRNEKKITTLKQLISQFPNSSYADDALFALASAYVVAKRPEDAIDSYDALINKHTQSPYRSKSMLNKGLILYNQERYDQAEKELKALVENYRRDAVGQQAVATLKEIAIDRGRVQDFTQWLESKQIQIYSASELEETTFLAAEKQLLTNNKEKALRLFEAYLAKYPDGINKLVANFYLAELYDEKQNLELAVDKYRAITLFPINEYTEKALVRLIEIKKSQEDSMALLPYLIQLREIAEFEENKRFAQFNLMQTYALLGDDLKAIQEAKQVLLLDDLKNKVKWDALTILAQTSWRVKDTLNAIKYYNKLEKAPQGSLVAEALYFKAKQLHDKANFDSSNEVIATIAEQSASSGVWGAKALLLLSKNYNALGDPFQAIYILESVIENFERFNDVYSEAQELLKATKQEAAKNNASITEQKNGQ